MGDDYTFFPSKTCVQEKAKQRIVKENHYQNEPNENDAVFDEIADFFNQVSKE